MTQIPDLSQTPTSSTAPGATDADLRRIGLVNLSILALVVGIVTGFGAVAFRDLIGLIHNLLFLGKWAVRYDANLFTPASPWGPYVILVPVLGSLAVTFLVNTFAPEARGHGVPEVMDAIYYGGGVIRPVVAVVKSLASAIAIGSGAAVGREGPIIQIGSALGSTLGQIVRMTPGERPSIPPEKLLRAQFLLQMLYTIRSERLLMEEMDYNLLFRWFVGLNADDEVWDPTTFSKNRDRLLQADVAKEFLARVVAIGQCSRLDLG